MLCDAVALFVDGEILSMLGNRCMDGGDDVEGNEFATVVGGSPLVVVSCVVSPADSIFCSSEGAGAIGTKNLAPSGGLTDGAAGDWNEFVSDPPLPLLLNVSTYLDRTPVLPRAEN